MEILGLTIAPTKSIQKDVSPVTSRGGWWPVIKEA
jgi:hypothetical protein